MPDAPDFDIYQTESGYAAVTSPVRRKILEALAVADRELPDLVRITGKAKPTLSSLHVKELLAQRLVEELPHPTDARRKVYRLRGQRIGSSNVPIEELHGAVQRYVAVAGGSPAVPFVEVLGILLSGAREGAEPVLRAQGVALGGRSASLFTATGPRDLLADVGTFWEREHVARPGKIDFDRLALEVVAAPSLASAGRAGAVAAMLGGFLEGVARARLKLEGAVGAKTVAGSRIVLTLPAR